jgi:glycosyltransferase involved in cell wall biosynthesis
MNGPLFSIITPTCKRPVLLQRAIESVLAQTFRDFELIVVDDGGDARTADAVRQYNDSRIVFVQHPHSTGAAASYNTGINLSRGALISILDDDDEYYPTFLEKTHLFFQSAPSHIGFVWTGIRRVIDAREGELLWYERKWPANIEPTEAGYIAATTIGNGFGLTMRSECIDTVGLYNETFVVCEDTEHLFRLARHFAFATIPEILVKLHRHHDGQLTDHSKNGLRLTLHERILAENASFIEPYPELTYVHLRRLAELSYSLRLKHKGRQILLRTLKLFPLRASIAVDFIFYECFGVNSETFWNRCVVKTILSRAKRSLVPGARWQL